MTAGGETIENDRCLDEQCEAGCFLMVMASDRERRFTRVLLRNGAKAEMGTVLERKLKRLEPRNQYESRGNIP